MPAAEAGSRHCTLVRWTEVQLPLLKQGAPTKNTPALQPPIKALGFYLLSDAGPSAGVGAALRGQRGFPLAVRRSDGESPPAFGFPHRSRLGAGWTFHAGDRVTGRQASGACKPCEPGRGTGSGQRRSGQFSPRRAAGEAAAEARRHVDELRRQVDSAEHAALSARQRAARKRAAAEKLKRLEEAVAQLPELKQKQAEAARRAGHGKRGEQIRARQPRVSTTDAEARGMKMPNGGFNPAVNVQLATDTASRASGRGGEQRR